MNSKKLEVEMNHSITFQNFKVQNLLQPWGYSGKLAVKIDHFSHFRTSKLFLQPWGVGLVSNNGAPRMNFYLL